MFLSFCVKLVCTQMKAVCGRYCSLYRPMMEFRRNLGSGVGEGGRGVGTNVCSPQASVVL